MSRYSSSLVTVTALALLASCSSSPERQTVRAEQTKQKQFRISDPGSLYRPGDRIRLVRSDCLTAKIYPRHQGDCPQATVGEGTVSHVADGKATIQVEEISTDELIAEKIQ